METFSLEGEYSEHNLTLKELKETYPETFDVLDDNGCKVGDAFNYNTLEIETDEECKTFLEKFRKELTLNEEEQSLIDTCIKVVEASCDDDVTFGPLEICQFQNMANNHPTHVKEIMACLKHINDSIEYQGDELENANLIMLRAANIFAELLNYSNDDDDSEELTESDEE